jgi:hypothetical protein
MRQHHQKIPIEIGAQGRANPSHGWERCAAALLVADWLEAATLTIAE